LRKSAQATRRTYIVSGPRPTKRHELAGIGSELPMRGDWA
jgi:hypothetical protein